MVDDRLFVRLKHANGKTTRWGADEPDASGIPEAITVSDAAPGGHVDASLTLVRDPRDNWPDLDLVDEIEIYGRTAPLGRKAFEGQTAHFPSQLGDDVHIGVNAVGNQVLLTENEAWQELYVALGFEGWGPPPLTRREGLAAGGFGQGRIQVSTGDGLVFDPPNENLQVNEIGEVVCQVAAGLRIAKVGYRGTRKGNWTNFDTPKLYGDDDEELGGTETVALTLDDTVRVAEFATPRKLALLLAQVTVAGAPALGTQQSFSRLAIYGDHGLTLREIEGGKELPGLYAHDVLGHMLDTGAPELKYRIAGDGSIIPNTSFVIPDLSSPARGKVSAAIEKLNAYFLNNWGVWDDKEFFWKPWDPDELTWDVSIAGGVHWSPAGIQAFGLLNGVIVDYTDAAGASRTAGPPGSGCDYEDASLQDTDPSNPYTRRGKKRWGVLEVGFPLAYPSTAFQVGHVYLLEHKMPQRSGTLVIRPKAEGHIPEIRHPTLGPCPIWALRSGDYAYLNGWPGSEPFRVIDKKYDTETKTLTAELDSGAMRMSAILERVGIRLKDII